MDRQSVLEGENEVVAVSLAYVESILTEEMIGKGFFETVFQGTDSELRRSFAIKAINREILRSGHSADIQKAKKSFQAEQTALSHFRHPNIAALYAYAFPEDVTGCYYLVYELAEKGSLDAFWGTDLGRERLSLFRRRVQIALDVMTAIQFLHVGNDKFASCFHRDIKPSNIVLKRDFTAQLIDCGLAKLVDDECLTQSTAGVKGTPGYLCPEYASGGIPFQPACDIFSYGVVLAELWTGRLQNHKNEENGTSFNFEKHYIRGKKGMVRNLKLDLDPALGYYPSDPSVLPEYVQDFADLVIACMQLDPDDRPAGESVMKKFTILLTRCCSENSDANTGIRFGDSVPSLSAGLELNSDDKCKICRTFPPMAQHSVCTWCRSAEEQRRSAEEQRMLILRLTLENRALHAKTYGNCAEINAKLDASLPVLGHLDARLNHPVPRLFIMVPAALKDGLAHSRSWLRSKVQIKFHLYFLCCHSMEAIEPPLKVRVTKCWIEKVAPVLAMSLVLLQVGLKAGVGIDLGLGEAASKTRTLTSSRIAEILEEVSKILSETGRFELLNRLRDKKLDADEINLLSGDAYELIVEVSGEERGWRARMEPVRNNGSPQIFWLSKQVACDTSNGYTIVKV